MKPIPLRTNQSLFDEVARHAFAQNEKALEKGSQTRCLYRTKNSDGKILKCFIGCLIPDEKYVSDCERENIHYIIIKSMIPGVNESHSDLLVDLQSIHDNFDIKNWREEFIAVAGRFGLSVNF